MPLILSCEHGGHAIPPAYRGLFAGRGAVVRSHRGWDPGALSAATLCAAALNVPLFAATVSRLVVDLNRSLHHRAVFSEFTRPLSLAAKQQVIDAWYTPHRTRVEQAIRARRGKVHHLCFHSFTPVFDGVERSCDLGILYDPSRAHEKRWARAFKAKFLGHLPAWNVRFNVPYKGTSDGFTTNLRRLYGAQRYVGIELEINQKHVFAGGARWRRLQQVVCACLTEL